MNLAPALRRPLVRWRRSLCEALGVTRYSWLGLNGLDRKLARHLDFTGGFFVEAGANDGLEQSNTYYFERIRGWTGLLVEPVPALAAACRRNRRAPVVEAALVAEDVPGVTVEIHPAGLMSTMAGAFGDAAAAARHVDLGRSLLELPDAPALRVPARTLSALLDEQRIERPIDLLCLDVEGAEPLALRGLDLRRHAPRYICVEVRDEPAITELLGTHYRMCEVLTDQGTYRDLLYARR